MRGMNESSVSEQASNGRIDGVTEDGQRVFITTHPGVTGLTCFHSPVLDGHERAKVLRLVT
jgi:hypothetical protein